MREVLRIAPLLFILTTRCDEVSCVPMLQMLAGDGQTAADLAHLRSADEVAL